MEKDWNLKINFTQVYWWHVFSSYFLDLREDEEHDPYIVAGTEIIDLKKWNHLLLHHAIVSQWFQTCLNDVVLTFKVDILATFQRLRAECLAVYAEIAMVVALTSLGSGASRSTEEDTLSQVGATDESGPMAS